MPLISESNHYEANDARYGVNIAAYPLRMIADIHNKTLYRNYENKTSLLFSSSTLNNTIILGNISSGNELPYVIIIKIIDLYGNIVKMDNA